MSTEDSKQVVAEFGRLAFQEKNPRAAADQYLAEDYIQHNPEVPNGREAFVAAIGGFFGSAPELSFDLKRVIAEDDLVVLHTHMKMSSEDRGSAVVDIFRVADGKVVEHWDVLQPVPEKAANDNTMF